MTMSIVSAKGWVVIPKEIRERLGLKKGSRVRFVEYGGVLRVIPEPEDPLDAIEELYGMFADGPSMTEALLREHAEEIEKEEAELGRDLRAG